MFKRTTGIGLKTVHFSRVYSRIVPMYYVRTISNTIDSFLNKGIFFSCRFSRHQDFSHKFFRSARLSTISAGLSRHLGINQGDNCFCLREGDGGHDVCREERPCVSENHLEKALLVTG